VAFGRDGVEHTSDDCKFTSTSGPYINNLISAVGNGTTAPSGYSSYPRGGHAEDKCTQNSGDSPINLPAGNWWISCSSGLTVKNSFTVGSPSTVVFQGGLTISSSGSVSIGDTAGNSVVYFRHGPFQKDAQASLSLRRTMVYLNADGDNNYIDFGAGSGTLTWTGPIGGNFDALTLWSESAHQHNFGGQASMSVDGVFFIPNATFSFTGQSSQDNTANAQFIINNLSMSGQGILRMQPNPDRLVNLPAWGAALIR